MNRQILDALQQAERRLLDLCTEDTGPCPTLAKVRAAIALLTPKPEKPRTRLAAIKIPKIRVKPAKTYKLNPHLADAPKTRYLRIRSDQKGF